MSDAPAGRPTLLRRVLHLVRRGHLYLGLLLLPWAVLYGVSAFLFNHPAAFPDQPTVQFGKDALAGTPMATLPPPRELAAEVVVRLNERHQPAVPWTLGPGEVRYGREFAFATATATATADGGTVSVLLDMKGTGGTVRQSPPPKPVPPPAPFAVNVRPPRPAPPAGGPADGITLSPPLAERVRQSVPAVLARTGFPSGEVTVTSVPDLLFPVEADGTTWTAAYHPLTGGVSGAPAEPPPALGWRSFVLKLHAAHGYPGEPNARWGWAVLADVTAAALVLWGLSGLAMWWQLKATRVAGAVVLAVSAAAATAMGFAMYAALSPPAGG